MPALMSNLSIVTASRLAAAGLTLITQVYLARWLSADALGHFFLATSMAAFIAIVGSCGFPMVVTRFVVRYRHRPSLAAQFMATARHRALIVSLFLGVMAIAAVYLWPGMSPDARRAVAIGCLAAPGFVLIRIGAAAAIADRRFALAYLPDLVGRPVLLLVVIALLSLSGTERQLTWILAAFAGLALLHGIWQNLALRHSHRSSRQRLAPERGHAGAQQRRLVRAWTRAAIPFTAALLLMAAFADIIVLTAGLFLSPADLAVLGVSVKLAMIVAFIQTAACKMLQPDFAEAVQTGNRIRFSRTIGQANALALMIAFGALAAVLASGDFALSLFGSHFISGQQALIILLAGQAVAVAGGPALQILTLGKGQIAVTRSSMTAIAVLPILMAALTPGYGLVGAALAVVVTQAIWSVLLSFAACRMTGIRCDIAAAVTSRLADLRDASARSHVNETDPICADAVERRLGLPKN